MIYTKPCRTWLDTTKSVTLVTLTSSLSVSLWPGLVIWLGKYLFYFNFIHSSTNLGLRIPAPFCMCSYGSPTCAAQLPYHLWEVCQARYAHPRFFDWKYYSENQLKPKYGREFSECEATTHWCSFGLSLGWNGTSQSSLREYPHVQNQ